VTTPPPEWQRANDEGVAAFGRGELEAAHRAFARAVAAWERLRGPDAVAAPLYENLGLACHNLSRSAEAVRCFLRALDGDLGARRQSARYLVPNLLALGRYAHALQVQRAFGAAWGDDAGLPGEDCIQRLAQGARAAAARHAVR